MSTQEADSAPPFKVDPVFMTPEPMDGSTSISSRWVPLSIVACRLLGVTCDRSASPWAVPAVRVSRAAGRRAERTATGGPCARRATLCRTRSRTSRSRPPRGVHHDRTLTRPHSEPPVSCQRANCRVTRTRSSRRLTNLPKKQHRTGDELLDVGAITRARRIGGCAHSRVPPRAIERCRRGHSGRGTRDRRRCDRGRNRCIPAEAQAAMGADRIVDGAARRSERGVGCAVLPWRRHVSVGQRCDPPRVGRGARRRPVDPLA